MRILSSYKKQYGQIEGPKILRRLQREAALASAHARHLKRLRRQAETQENPPPQGS